MVYPKRDGQLKKFSWLSLHTLSSLHSTRFALNTPFLCFTMKQTRLQACPINPVKFVGSSDVQSTILNRSMTMLSFLKVSWMKNHRADRFGPGIFFWRLGHGGPNLLLAKKSAIVQSLNVFSLKWAPKRSSIYARRSLVSCVQNYPVFKN